jgi:hypothetical protein
MTEIEQRAAVIAETGKWAGAKFAQNQCVPYIAVDCVRLPLACYRAAGVLAPTDEELPILPVDWHLHSDKERILEVVGRYFREVAEPRPGDLLVVRMGRVFSHCAIVVAWPDVIHAFWGSGVVLAAANKPPLAGRRRPQRFFSPWDGYHKAGASLLPYGLKELTA